MKVTHLAAGPGVAPYIIFFPPPSRRLKDVKSPSYQSRAAAIDLRGVLPEIKSRSRDLRHGAEVDTKSGREKRDFVNNLATQASDVTRRDATRKRKTADTERAGEER